LEKPIVSVICLCFNHENYIEEAINSVLAQTYDPTELIVVDDASTDGSKQIIEKLAKIHGFQIVINETNLGNCTSFNIGLKLSKGDYVIDLAADDQLLPKRIEIGVACLEQKGSEFGVHFCDVELIDENAQSKGTHFKRNENGELSEFVPEGDIYKILLERYFLSAPSMLMRKNVLDKLRGYDENLTYEDFDFWIRSSRTYKYAFTDQVLVKKRILSNSLSSIQYQRKNRHSLSTAIVCQKALNLNQTKEENQSLLKRINYELKWALITENWESADLFMIIKERLAPHSITIPIQKLMLKIKPNWFPLWKRII